MTIVNLQIDHVRVVGAAHVSESASELRALVIDAVKQALDRAALPDGRVVKASVEVHVPSLSTGASIAVAVANGVVQAVGGHTRG